jgi:uncharacterized short protein YbdD (DUF466 family)
MIEMLSSALCHGAAGTPVSYPTAGVRRLRPTVFRRLLACMPATKRSIPLSAVRLKTGAPELGTPDFTELRRTCPRPFPKDAGERDCYRYLLEQMQATPDRPRGTKAEFEKTCRSRFDVMVDSFEYCWREAIDATGACWDQPGRRPRKKNSH